MIAQAPAADSLRTVLRQVFSAREYEWQEPHNLFLRALEWLSRAAAWFDRLKTDSPAAYYSLVGAMVLVLAAVFAHGAYVYWRSTRRLEHGFAPVGASVADIHDARWHLREAARLRDAGRCTEALGHRFVALLLQLEAARALTFHPSKTPAEYVGEARLDDPGRAALAALVATLYRHLFGGVPCTADDWAGFDHRAAEVPSHAGA